MKFGHNTLLVTLQKLFFFSSKVMSLFWFSPLATVLISNIFFQEKGYEMVNFLFFCVYQIGPTCPTIRVYPQNCCYGPFSDNDPKNIKNNISPKRLYFSFSLVQFQHTCWIIWCLYAQNCEFWGDINHELYSFSLFPIPTMLINTISSFIDRFS